MKGFWRDYWLQVEEQLPPLKWYGISVNVADCFSPETKSLQQKLMQMGRLRRWLSFRMRARLRRTKVTEFVSVVMQQGTEAIAEIMAEELSQ